MAVFDNDPTYASSQEKALVEVLKAAGVGGSPQGTVHTSQTSRLPTRSSATSSWPTATRSWSCATTQLRVGIGQLQVTLT